jgi:glutaredoxin
MNIVVYLHESRYKHSTLKVLDLLKQCNLTCIYKTFKSDDMIEISETLGEKIRRYPQVVIDGDRIGGYYDLVEHLINKEVITYTGIPKWEKKS